MYLCTRYGFRCCLARGTLRDDYFGKEAVLQQIAAHQRNDEDASDNRGNDHFSRIVVRRIIHRCHGGPRLPGHGCAVALLAALLVPALLWACLLVSALLVSALLRLCLLVSALLVSALLVSALLVSALLVSALLRLCLLVSALLRLCLLVSALLVAAHRLARIRLAIVGRELGTHDGLSGR